VPLPLCALVAICQFVLILTDLTDLTALAVLADIWVSDFY
jgi:hypothetical protein